MCSQIDCNHDLDDNMDDVFGPGLVVSKADADAGYALARAQPMKMVTEPCKACRGTGRFVGYTGRVLGDCFKCKGKGTMTFRSTLEQREKAATHRAAAKVRKLDTITDQARAWAEANPEDYAWMTTKSFAFARSMVVALNQYGHLTEKQHATVIRLREGDAKQRAVWEAERAFREQSAAAIDVDKLAEAFATAKANLLMYPKIRLGGFVFSPAGANSANAGAIYVKGETDTYLGKVMRGRFTRSRDCTADLETAIVAAVADPEAAAAAYGLQTGRCSCCGRLLTNKDSVGLGIGPICREKFGW